MIRSLPARCCSIRSGIATVVEFDLPAHQRRHRRPVARIGHLGDLEVHVLFVLRDRQEAGAARLVVAVADLAGIGAHLVDILFQVGDAARCGDRQRVGVFAEERQRLELVDRVRIRIEIGQRDAAGAEHADGVAVWLGIDDFAVADRTARTCFVEHDDRRVDLLAQRIRDQAHRYVAAAARGPRHDQRDRSCRERVGAHHRGQRKRHDTGTGQLED